MASKNDDFEPYIKHTQAPPEFTWKAAIIGISLGILFAWANAYVGLISGLTISASIPASVMSVAIFTALYKFFKTPKASPLETNMSQTIGSAGESLAAGVIFTIPAMFMLGWDVSYGMQVLTISTVAAIGGALGVTFMIPLRQYLIKKEHKVLPYPEGTACAEVIKSADLGGASAKNVFVGLGLGAIVELARNGFYLFATTIEFPTVVVRKMVVALDANPALLGVGYILKRRISTIMVAGGAVSWFILIPILAYIGDSLAFLEPVKRANGIESIAELGPHDIWHYFIRFIGAGAVAFGGIITLIRAIPTVIESFKLGSRQMMKGADTSSLKRTDTDIPIKVVLWISIAIFIILTISLLAGLEHMNLGVAAISSILVVIFSFFFVTVASRIVGLVGSTSSPVSGMTIATLLGTSIIFVLFGFTGGWAMIAALTIGAIVCMAACISGDTSQDLKTGFLVGATPRKQQIGEFIGTLSSAAVLGFTLIALYNAYGFAEAPSPLNGKAELAAPQATLMSFVVRGVIEQSMPWILVAIGAIIAAIFELFKIPSLPAAVGLYLPLETTTPIFVGGMLRHYRDKLAKSKTGESDRGVLYSSGLVAGVGLIGVLLAVTAVINYGKDETGATIYLLDAMRHWVGQIWEIIPGGEIFSMILAGIVFILLIVHLYSVARKES
jgi:putative OPT family oligopeptide transporter